MHIARNYILKEAADKLFKVLEKEVPWNNGIITKYGGVSRLQANIDECNNEISTFLTDLVTKILSDKYKNFTIFGVYLNYYRDGSDYCPKHRHTDTKQMIISLGSKRTINIDDIDYDIDSGDIIFFDSEQHSIRKKNKEKSSRISIATFYIYV